MYEVFCQTVGIANENTYSVVSSQKNALIIDPGAEAKKLIQWIKDNQWTPCAILLTHCHFDHIGALDEIRAEFNIPAYVHPIELNWVSDARLNLSTYMASPVEQSPVENTWDTMGEMTLFDFSFRIEHVPGHSPGHVVYIFENSGFVIAGDTLFRQSIGRTDLPYGNYQQLLSGITQKLLTLPDQTIVYPGHGDSTTIQDEKANNSFLVK